ncbi:hypothetical protein Y886_30640 [Xanthomonas hyacinthi DSM 19077]|nr:hypothetical protein Y886_30640 [Xanthomonas hyacinthi DSM 19077]
MNLVARIRAWWVMAAVVALAFLAIVVQSSDVRQCVWGTLIGGHLIAPKPSPSKTVEGLVDGLLSASALGAALWWITPFSPLQAFALALVANLMGFFGGLVRTCGPRSPPHANPYSFSFLRSVARWMPSIAAARLWLPSQWLSTSTNSGISISRSTISYTSSASQPSRSRR